MKKNAVVSRRNNKKNYTGRRLLYSFILFLKCAYDALSELDRRTDITARLTNYVQLNDDEYYDEDLDSRSSHFGLVRLSIVLLMLPMATQGLGVIVALLQ